MHAVVLVIATTAATTANETIGVDALAARVNAVLVRRGLGSDALSVIGNVLTHEGPPPRAAPPIVRELLAQPLRATDAAMLFDRSIPAGPRNLANPAPPRASGGPAVDITELLAVYIGELAEAQRLLRIATDGIAIDGAAVVRDFDERGLSSSVILSLAATTDLGKLERATNAFLDATARFIRVLTERSASVSFPAEAVRFESPVGMVSIGARGDDRHGPDAAIIIDPGGNDTYERAPTTRGAVSVIVDLGGDDRYLGRDVVVDGFSAIIDFSGNDRYKMNGAGLGAAVLGASLIVDFAGDDAYEATRFAQGAAAFGIGALIDLAGNDRYRVQNSGQGFGMAGGVGVLWDRSGDDTYVAGGVRDAYDRGGGISMAQGAASGIRTSAGGGIGILRDDAGNDAYEAEMFAQGVGYYYGVGLLWDRNGNDRYRAVRYAQGNGVHEAVGTLRDEAGNDRYELTFGVGQGMGLDLAAGILFDAAGDDRYESQVLAQGAATANGIGIVIDVGGADEWRMGADTRSWGRAEWQRGLPTLGLLLYEPSGASFWREGKRVDEAPALAAFGGPLGNAPPKPESAVEHRCAAVESIGSGAPLPLAQALRRIGPGFAGGSVNPEIYADVARRLTEHLDQSLAEIPADDFDVLWSFSMALRCAFNLATDDEALAMWSAIETALNAEVAAPLAGALAGVLRARRPPSAQTERIVSALGRHPWCSVRASALLLRESALTDDAARPKTIAAAQAALSSACWQLQATARSVLQRLDVEMDAAPGVASFLRGDADSKPRASVPQ